VSVNFSAVGSNDRSVTDHHSNTTSSTIGSPTAPAAICRPHITESLVHSECSLSDFFCQSEVSADFP
jgi:hypothetical protein